MLVGKRPLMFVRFLLRHAYFKQCLPGAYRQTYDFAGFQYGGRWRAERSQSTLIMEDLVEVEK